MSWQQLYGITSLIHHLVSIYFAQLTSVLIVYESGSGAFRSDLQQQYLESVQQAFQNQSRNGNIIGLQWINVQHFNDDGQHLEEKVLNAVNRMAVEGFITILKNTTQFLHARYYATRYSTLRLKDKLYLYLCESAEPPTHFLANEILQFYPHHLMVIPKTIYPECNNSHNAEQQNNKNNNKSITILLTKTENRSIKQTFLAARKTKNNLKVTNATNDVTTIAATLKTVTGDTNCNYKYRDINFELWTQQYVGAEGNLNAIHLDTFISGNATFTENVHLYPNKLSNQQQRAMRIGTLTYAPYTKVYFVPTGEGDVDYINSKGPPKTVKFAGSEAEIIKTFCIIHNCHLRAKLYPADDWGVIYENGTTEGILGDLYKQYTEMAVGCIYNWYNEVTETSQFIARSAVTILGPGPVQYPRWRTIIMPFSIDLWLFLIFAMVLCSIVFHMIKYYSYRIGHLSSDRENKYKNAKTYEKTLLDIYAVFIQQSSADTVLHRVATRIFLAFLLCATITLENTYSGQLKSILTMPLYSEPIDTMEKWSLTGWHWAAPALVWIHTVEKSDLPKEQRLTKNFEVRDYDYMYKSTFWDDYGLGLERVYSGTFNFEKYVTTPVLDKKVILKDDLYFDWSRVIAIRGWPLMPIMNSHILHCLETGLFIYWERQASYQFLDNQIQDILIKLASGYKPKSPPQMLSIEHISGTLFILLFGYFSAFIVLMIEIFGHRLKRLICQVSFYLHQRLSLRK